jgi:hypothetical protein
MASSSVGQHAILLFMMTKAKANDRTHEYFLPDSSQIIMTLDPKIQQTSYILSY